MKARKILVVTLGTATAAGVVLLAVFLALFERVETKVHVRPSDEAKENHLLAAERLFRRLGVEAHSVRGPFHLPSEDHVLVMTPSRHASNWPWHKSILDWVRRGGHLIVGYRKPSADFELLQPLDVKPHEITRLEKGIKEDLKLWVQPDGRSYKVEMERFALFRPSERMAPELDIGPPWSSGYAYFLRYRIGRGRVTVLGDPSFLDNENLGRYEHASFAWALVSTPFPPAGVWLVYDDTIAPDVRAGGGARRSPDLGRLIRERGMMLAVSLGLWLAAWVAYRGARFGPLLPSAAPPRRSLAEHLLASGGFLYRHGEGAALVAAVRRAVLGQARRKRPAWRQPAAGGEKAAASREQIDDLASLAGLPRGVVARALEEPVGEDPSRSPPRGASEKQFTRTIAVLEEIRRSL